MNKIRRLTIQTSTIALLTLLGGCGDGEAKTVEVAAADTGTPLPVVIAQPFHADIYARYSTTGTLQSDVDAPILSRASGQIVEILVEEGDFVEAGQLLVRVDGELTALQMQQAKANLDKSSNEYARLVDLAKRGLVSVAMYEGMQFDIDALRAAYELKKLDYSYTFIRAPFSGVVSTREIKVGGHLKAGDATFRITDLSRLVTYLKIPQTELGKFAAGQTMRLRVDAIPEQAFDASIERISPTIDPSNGTFRATAYVENKDRLMAPGMFGRFRIAYARHDNALVIPAAALLKEDGGAIVYVVLNGEAIRRSVDFGIESDGLVEILGGLETSDQVVVNGQSGLRDGSRVLTSVAPAERVSS